MYQQQKIYWIGIRESEIKDTGQIFDGSITIFGSNKGNNYSFEKEHHIRINYNEDNQALNDFIHKTVEKILQKDPQCKFLLYYPMEASEYSFLVEKHAFCINSPALTDLFENKIYTKLWASRIIPVIPFTTMIGTELDYHCLCEAFPHEKEFVIQATFSCGGSGTWLISNDEDLSKILSDINLNDVYTVTPFKRESISANVHLIIYEQKVLTFPASIQIIYENRKHLCYGGADFFTKIHLPEKIICKIQTYANMVGKHLQAAGYRGICGIDFLTTKEEAFFLEINARFQSSSFIINEALKKLSLPSLQELHIDAFNTPTPLYSIPELDIPRSFYNFSLQGDTKEQIMYIWKVQNQCPEICQCIDDELDWNIPMEENTYLFKLVFNTNITCTTSNYTSRLYNIFDNDSTLLKGIAWDKQIKRLKVLLLNQGVRVSKEALNRLSKHGGLNYEIFYAVDLSIEDKLYINVPYKVDFSELSFFEIDYMQNEYWLNYFGKPLARVSIRTNDPLAHCLTQNNVTYNEISYLGVDRLRIHQRNGCYFKDHNLGCSFCDIERAENKFVFEDIKEIIQTYKDTPSIRHYLVGGGSQNPSDDFSDTLKIIEYLHSVTDKNIYLMSIPPKETGVLQQLKNAGVTEIAFNLEIFDRKTALKYMRGKGALPLERYENAFKAATILWGKTGNVRSALIIGLEPADSTLKGVEYLCRLGVSPILSLLKPAYQLENFWSPSSKEVLYIWEQAESICQKYGMMLGPSCHCCEDNVLKATLEYPGV